ncbi:MULTISPECIES: hypothetical protein [unclassified Corynebacterium]|nr:hypothetical protein [Corynebacterium sp.]MDY5785399.1 hypothetical protein [Corynebacterium sp.]
MFDVITDFFQLVINYTTAAVKMPFDFLNEVSSLSSNGSSK